MKCKSAGVCEICSLGYMLKDGKCIYCNGCRICNPKNPTQCLSCFKPEVLDKVTATCGIYPCSVPNC